MVAQRGSHMRCLTSRTNCIRNGCLNALLMGDSHPEHTLFKTEVLDSEDTRSSENYSFSEGEEGGEEIRNGEWEKFGSALKEF